MHVQVASYRMTDISDADFIAANKEFAAMMSVIPRSACEGMAEGP